MGCRILAGSQYAAVEAKCSTYFNEHNFKGAGLKNLGNTCFLNSILQCLMHTGPLVQRILQIKHSYLHCGDNDEFCSICCLKELIINCLFSQKFVVVPSKFAENLSKIAPSFQLGEEEDAHEFLGSMLNSLDACCRGGCTKEKKTSDDDSIVNQVFGGSVSSQLRCCACGYCSKTVDPVLDLSLEIDDVDTIEDALASYTKVEPIEGQFTCEGCKAQVSMEKQLKLDRIPEVVILHLKRFKFTAIDFQKIDKHVEYPLVLDFQPFLSCPEDNVDLKYDLYAVVVHHGSIQSGHYFCSVRSSPTTWHRMDDSMVTRVSESDVLDEDAYLLFYIKRGSSCQLPSLLEIGTCVTSDASPISVLDHVHADEASCSTSPRTMPERSTNVNPSINSSVLRITFPNDVESPHAVISSGMSSDLLNARDEADMVAADKFLTPSLNHDRSKPADIQPPMPELAMDMFTDELSEDEKEEHRSPQHLATEQRSKRPADFVKDPREREPVLKLLRGMAGSRRQGLMSCLVTQRGYKHGQPMIKNQHKIDASSAPSFDRNKVPQQTPESQSDRRVLSPRSIRRGLLFAYNDDE